MRLAWSPYVGVCVAHYTYYQRQLGRHYAFGLGLPDWGVDESDGIKEMCSYRHLKALRGGVSGVYLGSIGPYSSKGLMLRCLLLNEAQGVSCSVELWGSETRQLTSRGNDTALTPFL